VGYGESIPLKPNTSKVNKQLNRRVEIVAEKGDGKTKK
jgi:flagellar motor protein MotB